MSKNDSNPKNYIIRGPKLKIGQLNHKESEAFNLNQQPSEIDTRVIYTLGLTTIFNLKKYTPQTYQTTIYLKQMLTQPEQTQVLQDWQISPHL